MDTFDVIDRAGVRPVLAHTERGAIARVAQVPEESVEFCARWDNTGKTPVLQYLAGGQLMIAKER